MTPNEHPLFPVQEALEKEMREKGIERFHRLHEAAATRGEWSDTAVGRSLVTRIIVPFVEAVREFIGGSPGPGRHNAALVPLREFNDPEAAAYLAIRMLLNAVAQNRRSRRGEIQVTTLAASIGTAIHDEFRMRYFDKNHKALLGKLWSDFNRRDLSRRRRKELVQRQFAALRMDWRAEGWTQQVTLRIGMKLLDLLMGATGIATITTTVHHKSSGKSQTVLRINSEFMAAMEDKTVRMQEIMPIYYPMVVPPRPWSNNRLYGGGYWTTDTRQYPLVKRARRGYLEDLESCDLSNVLAAVNAVQSTPRRINKDILSVVETLSERGDIAGLPPSDDRELPQYPANYEDMDDDAKREFNRQRYLIREDNRAAVSKRLANLTAVSIARRFAEYPAIYFPHNMDSRGRLYPVPQYLNPQGPDVVKALLDFAEEKPIDTDQARDWLYIAAANAWGFDKAPLDDRADWVVDNQEMVFSVAADPLDDLRWTEAEEPFQFLRLAMDIRGYAEAQAEGRVFMSRAVVPVDATCSGLQHFSAMLRDAVGGEATNLTDSTDRKDVYLIVAEKVTERLHMIVERDDPEFAENPDAPAMAAAALDFGVERGLTKRSVMVVPYAGTMHSCTEYVRAYYDEEIRAGRQAPWEPLSKFCGFISKLVWKAIGETVIAARECMTWLGKMTRLACSGENPQPIFWVTPAGLPVRQWVPAMDTHRLAVTWFDGTVSRFNTSVETPRPDTRRMGTSVPPNLVHSLDASHLQLTVCRSLVALEDGEISSPLSWSLVHDSYGTHAADMPALCQFLRQAFVYQYEKCDVIEEFSAAVMPQIPDEANVPPRPSRGSLDLSKVLDSEFFFS